jgi:exodeoxyribonuclease VII small subunit
MKLQRRRDKAMPKAVKDKSTLEEKLEALRKITASLEKGDQPLDKALVEFESGIALYRECLQMIEEAERRVRILTGEELKPFEETTEVVE